MRILFVLNSTKIDGSVISAINLMTGLTRLGVQCYVVQPDTAIDPIFIERTKGIVEHTYYAPLRPHVMKLASESKGLTGKLKRLIKGTRTYWIFASRNEIKAIRSIISEIEPDIVHTNAGIFHAGYYASKSMNVPHVWHLREYQDKDFHYEPAPSFSVFHQALMDSYVITISNDILTYFQLQDSPKAQCIYNGCLSVKDASYQGQKRDYFLCCSRISPEKGQESVIRAFASFRTEHPSYKLVIAGTGEAGYVDHLKDVALQVGCQEAVVFIGFQKDVKPLMREARALIVASVYEGFGRMTAEACFCGCAVIGHNTGGTKEILDITGGFPYDDDGELLQQMNTVADLDSPSYQKVVLEAQQKALSTFSIEQNISKTYALYKKVLDI